MYAADDLVKEMAMVFRRVLIFLCSCMMPAMLWADPLESGFLFIQYLGKHKENSGQVSQIFQLVCTDPKVDKIDVFYQENRDPTLYQVKVIDGGFTISVDQSSRIQVFAIARTPHKTFLAHTDTVLFGQSKTPPERRAADQTAAGFLSIHPYIDLIVPEKYYWNQTGQTFRFVIKKPYDLQQFHLSVRENGTTHELILNQQSEFVYVPPHDRNLRKTGVQAFRNDILFARVAGGASEFNLTYTLMVHRSRHAFDNHAAGMTVFASSMILFAGLILLKRKTPWWKNSV